MVSSSSSSLTSADLLKLRLSNGLISCMLCANAFGVDGHIPCILRECGHTFCDLCLSNLQRETQACIECPSCRKPCKPSHPLIKNTALLLHLEQYQAVQLAKTFRKFRAVEVEKVAAQVHSSACFALRVLCSATEAKEQLLQSVSRQSPKPTIVTVDDDKVCTTALGRTIQEIEEEFALLTRLLERRKATLIQAVTDVALRRSQHLDKQVSDLRFFLSECYEALHHVVDSLQPTCTDSDCSLPKQRFERLIKLAAKKSFPNAVEAPVIQVVFNKDARTSISSYGAPSFPGRVAQERVCMSTTSSQHIVAPPAPCEFTQMNMRTLEQVIATKFPCAKLELRFPGLEESKREQYEGHRRRIGHRTIKGQRIPLIIRAIESDELSMLHNAFDRKGSAVMDAVAIDGMTPMQFAASTGRASAVAYLACMGSRTVDTPDMHGRTPLYLAAVNQQFSSIEALIQAGSQSLDTPDRNGRTPLHAAAQKGLVFVIETLVGLGSRAIDTPDRDGKTPVHSAALFQQSEVLNILCKLGSNSFTAEDKFHLTPLHHAILGRRVQAIELLVQLDSRVVERSRTDRSVLHLAVAIGDCGIIETLVRLGCCRLDETGEEFTAMHTAAKHDNADAIETLVNLGSRHVDTCNHSGQTPLHIAAQHHHTRAIETLARLGSQAIDLPTKEGDLPLTLAACSSKRNPSFRRRRGFEEDPLTDDCIQLLLALFPQASLPRHPEFQLDEDNIACIRFDVYFSRSLTVRLLAALGMRVSITQTSRSYSCKRNDTQLFFPPEDFLGHEAFEDVFDLLLDHEI